MRSKGKARKMQTNDVTGPVQDPLAVLLLYNRLYIPCRYVHDKDIFQLSWGKKVWENCLRPLWHYGGERAPEMPNYAYRNF